MARNPLLALTIGLELFVLFSIRDNLTLNIVMLIYPLETIRQAVTVVVTIISGLVD